MSIVARLRFTFVGCGLRRVGDPASRRPRKSRGGGLSRSVRRSRAVPRKRREPSTASGREGHRGTNSPGGRSGPSTRGASGPGARRGDRGVRSRRRRGGSALRSGTSVQASEASLANEDRIPRHKRSRNPFETAMVAAPANESAGMATTARRRGGTGCSAPLYAPPESIGSSASTAKRNSALKRWWISRAPCRTWRTSIPSALIHPAK